MRTSAEERWAREREKERIKYMLYVRDRALMRSLDHIVKEILERNWQFEFIMCRMDPLEAGIKLIANKEIGEQEPDAEGDGKKE